MGNTETMKGMGRAGRVNVKRKEAEITSNQPCAAAQIHGCAREKQKLEQNVLDGADFVRDVIDSYPVLRSVIRGISSKTLSVGREDKSLLRGGNAESLSRSSSASETVVD